MSINKGFMNIKPLDVKNIDTKTIIIIILTLVLIISFFFGQNNNIDKHSDEIKMLHDKNIQLTKKNDSLKNENIKIDAHIKSINKKIDNNSTKIIKTDVELNKLKTKRNEKNLYVNHLSTNGVADEFSKYLNKRTKSNSSNK